MRSGGGQSGATIGARGDGEARHVLDRRPRPADRGARRGRAVALVRRRADRPVGARRASARWPRSRSPSRPTARARSTAWRRGARAARRARRSCVADDELARFRQVAVVDAHGNVGRPHRRGLHRVRRPRARATGFSAQANMMASPEVWPAMAHAFEAAAGPLARRLLAALHAAEARGGDVARAPVGGAGRRARATGEPWRHTVDLRVDDHPEPLAELDRLLDLHDAYALADRGRRPRRRGPPRRGRRALRAAPARWRPATTSCCSGPASPPRRPATCRRRWSGCARRSRCSPAGATCSTGSSPRSRPAPRRCGRRWRSRARNAIRDRCIRNHPCYSVCTRNIAQTTRTIPSPRGAPMATDRSNHHLDARPRPLHRQLRGQAHGRLDLPRRLHGRRPARSISPATHRASPATVDVATSGQGREPLRPPEGRRVLRRRQHAEDQVRLDSVRRATTTP